MIYPKGTSRREQQQLSLLLLDFNMKLKKSIWMSGGFEMNYRPAVSGVVNTSRTGAVQEATVWQQSGLIGLSKKFNVKTKYFKNTSLKLLWDFLSYQQVPRAQPIVFRVGYSLK